MGGILLQLTYFLPFSILRLKQTFPPLVSYPTHRENSRPLLPKVASKPLSNSPKKRYKYVLLGIFSPSLVRSGHIAISQ